MIAKLAFRNLNKSFRDYTIYFLTLVTGISIFYMFNSVYEQAALLKTTQIENDSIRLLQTVLSIASIFVAIVLGFLLVYANNFFVKRRKKELGIYLILGMEQNQISKIFVLETFLLAWIALIVGLVVGIFGSQIMSIFTAKLFEADLTEYKFIFSSNAFLQSILFFGIIFLVIILFNVNTIRKCTLIDLLYAERKNEHYQLPNLKLCSILFILSILSLSTAYSLILWNGLIPINFWFCLSILLGISGTLLFYYSVSGILIVILQKNKNLYFKGLNMFVLRQLVSKAKTNYITISVICILLFLVISIFSAGYSIQESLSTLLKESSPYDFSIYTYCDANTPNNVYDQDFYNKLLQNPEIENYATHTVYHNNITCQDILSDYKTQIAEFDLNDFNKDEFVYFVSLEDMNAALALQGKQPLELNDNEYAVIVNSKYLLPIANLFLENEISISLNQESFSPSSVHSIAFSNQSNQLTIVVPQKYLQNLSMISQISQVLNIQCTKEADQSLIQQQIDQSGSFTFFLSRITVYQGAISTKALVSFLAIYLGLVFILVSATILAIHQLSEATENKHRYLLLKKLGAEKKMMNSALFTQILCYFFFPLFLAVIHSIVGLIASDEVIQTFGKINVSTSIVATFIFIVIAYGFYFMLTYLSSKKMIEKE